MLQFIANELHYKQVLEKSLQVKKSLWIGTANIKDVYVKYKNLRYEQSGDWKEWFSEYYESNFDWNRLRNNQSIDNETLDELAHQIVLFLKENKNINI